MESIPYLLDTLAHFTASGAEQDDDLTILDISRLAENSD
jgi:hypothetical protein